MSNDLTLTVPATLTVLNGADSLSSLEGAGPAINLSGAAPGDIVVATIVAGNTAAVLGSTDASGATLSSTLNTLSLTGTQAQVDAALAGLTLLEPWNATSDVLNITATDTAAVAAQGALGVDVVAQTGPAFVAPPASISVQGNQLTTLTGLLLADPIAAGLAQMGLGAEETLSLTLSVADGLLLLPADNDMTGITASGIGSGTIELNFSADEIAALNTLLARLEYVGPDSIQSLQYALWNAGGVLPRVVTYGKLFIHTLGTAAPDGTFVSGGETLITGGTSFAGTINVTGLEAVLGSVSGGAADIAPGGTLVLPDDALSLSGISTDFGALAAQELTLSGSLLLGDGASFAAGVSLAAGAGGEFAGGLIVDGAVVSTSSAAGLSMAAGAVLTGSGTLMAGNLSQAAVVAGGTLLALGGETMEIDASLVTAAHVQVAGGGVMVLGPVSPLFGVFDTTPLTIDSSVTLDFLSPGAEPVSGGYASTLGGTGGAFVIAGPQYFSGTITGFTVGDELIFPDLDSVSIYNVGTDSFQMAGLDVFGNTDTYTIHTSIAAGLAPASGLDAEGDVDIFMRATQATVTQAAALSATPGVAQPLLGVSVDMTGSNTQSLSLTLTASQGVLSSNGGTAAAQITLTAANIAALNSELSDVLYTGGTNAGVVAFTSNSGLLAGVQGSLVIAPAPAGTVDGYAGLGVTEADMVTFGLAAGLPRITQPLPVGGVAVSGQTEFDDMLLTSGYGGTGLLVDDAGEAILGPAAFVSLAGDVTLGDAGGAGTLVVLGDAVSASGNVTVASAAGADGSTLAILGAMSIAGTLNIGLAAAGMVQLAGSLDTGPVSVGSEGAVRAFGTAQAALGGLTSNGTIMLTGAAGIDAAYVRNIGLLELGGTAVLDVAGLAMDAAAGSVSIGGGAVLEAATFTGLGGLDDAGLLTAGVSIAVGATMLDGGTLAAPLLRVTGMLSGQGVLAAASVINSGTIEAAGGRLLIAGNMADAGLVEIGTGAILEAGGTIGVRPVVFEGADGELVLDDAAAAQSFSVSGMVAGDAVDLVGIRTSQVSIGASGAGVILNNQGSVARQFTLQQSGTLQPGITVVSDGSGGALLTVGGVLPCFARGTGILSPHGYRPVESLRPNDPVITANGERRPVRWIGWRTLDLGPAAQRAARPVLVKPNAFGPGRPAKLLRLSPSHCVYVRGVLVPVAQLVNGATILHDTAAQAATYFHIELDRHDIVLADGLECESYFDDGNRAAMYQELGRRSPARRLCATLVTSGARLAAIRRALHDIALDAGFETRFQPALRAVAAGMSAVPEMLRKDGGRVARFAFPRAVKTMVLLSTTACPADTDPDSEDRRELGICLGTMRGVRLGAGWQARAAADAGHWMGSAATLELSRARRVLELPLAAVAQSWAGHRPLDAWRMGG